MFKVKKIAVLRANALGDFIFALPALQALRESYPKSEIVLLGKKWHQEFLTGRPSPIDRVIPLPPMRGIGESENYVNDTKQINKFINSIKNECFSIAIQIHGGGRFSNTFINRIGAKLSVGLRTSDAESLDINVPYIYYQNEYLRYLEVVAKINARTADIFPRINVINKDIIEAESYINSIKPYIVIHPGASDVRRRWPTKKFAVIGDTLTRRGYRIFITGIQNEQSLAREIINHMHSYAYDLTGRLSLGGLTGLLYNAELIISNDTGPLHLAESLGTRAVGIYWCTNVITGGFPYREITRPLLSWTVNCPICGTDILKTTGTSACEHAVSFVDKITTLEVIQAADSLLRQTDLKQSNQEVRLLKKIRE